MFGTTFNRSSQNLGEQNQSALQTQNADSSWGGQLSKSLLWQQVL